jgi:hypothetical protein
MEADMWADILWGTLKVYELNLKKWPKKKSNLIVNNEYI